MEVIYYLTIIHKPWLLEIPIGKVNGLFSLAPTFRWGTADTPQIRGL
jgi:hypothetical protein